LTITKDANNVILSWPASATGFTLYATPSLTSPDWQPAGTPTQVGDNLVVTNAVGTGNKFYQLRK
jgi:hypothetical protein